jgi:hypothetical protein
VRFGSDPSPDHVTLSHGIGLEQRPAVLLDLLNRAWAHPLLPADPERREMLGVTLGNVVPGVSQGQSAALAADRVPCAARRPWYGLARETLSHYPIAGREK